MNEILIAALINARVAEAHVKLEACRAANLERLAQGHTPAYGEAEFLGVIDECGIHHNAVHSLIDMHRDG